MISRLRNLLTFLGAGLLLVTIVPPAWYGQWLARPWTDARGPILIVLGGDSVREGVMGEASYWRCVYALDVWKEGSVKRIVLSGDSETTASMRDWILSHGVPADALLLENQSKSTRENALFTIQLLRDVPGPYLLLTSDIHTWRARRVFGKAGLMVLPRPAPDAFKRANDWRNRCRVFIDIGDECVKIVYYASKGWI